MTPRNNALLFDLQCLFWILLINFGLCLLLAYKTATMSVSTPEQLSELRSILKDEIDERDRKLLIDKLFEVVDKREETRSSFRDVVLKFAIGMIPLYLTGLVLVFRVVRSLKNIGEMVT